MGLTEMTVCPCCGGRAFTAVPVLWQALIGEWRLSPEEASYVDRQQGLTCDQCRSNLRSMALGHVIKRRSRLALRRWLLLRPWLRTLEINNAGQLTQFFRGLPRHQLTSYPEVDMMALPFDDKAFDLVIHSDTLEHVPDPTKGLAECRRVLKDRGRLCFTVPIIIGRSTISRHGMPPSYHGSPTDGYEVHTEYGMDVWRQPAEAGFSRCTFDILEFPAGIAIEAQP